MKPDAISVYHCFLEKKLKIWTEQNGKIYYQTIKSSREPSGFNRKNRDYKYVDHDLWIAVYDGILDNR